MIIILVKIKNASLIINGKMEIMSGEVAIFELECLLESKLGKGLTEEKLR